MAQHDYDIANAVAATVRTDLNNLFTAIASNNSGSSEPSTMFANQWWYDTTNNLLKIRNEANSAWITLGELDQASGVFLPYVNGSKATYAGSGPTGVQVLTGSGTYTPAATVRSIIVEMVGAGGGGGGADGQGSGTAALAGGGAAGAYLKKLISSLAASYTYSAGAAGSGGAAGVNNGTNGGDTTFVDGVSLTLTARGGLAGAGRNGASGGGIVALGGAGQTATGGDINVSGADGEHGISTSGNGVHYGNGADSQFGRGGRATPISGSGPTANAGSNGSGYGAGGSGAAVVGSTSNSAGGNGTAGVIIVWEFA